MADTKQSKGDRTRANQEAAGIPDSKPFAAPHAEPTGETRMLNSHINGVLISELNLPPHVVGALDWNATDEGIAEAALNPNLREASGITMGAGPFEKALQQRRDDVKDRDMNLWESRDPMKEIADKYAVPGMKSKFIKKSSGGTGDHQVVKDPNGDPVTVKNMILGHVPIEVADARRRHYQDRGNQLLKQIGETYKREGGSTAVSDQ